MLMLAFSKQRLEGKCRCNQLLCVDFNSSKANIVRNKYKSTEGLLYICCLHLLLLEKLEIEELKLRACFLWLLLDGGGEITSWISIPLASV